MLTAFTFTSCGDDESDDFNNGNNKTIVGTWQEDTSTSDNWETWKFSSNNSIVIQYYCKALQDIGMAIQQRSGSYILNNGVLTVKIDEKVGQNSAYTHKYVVTTLTETSLVIVSDDEFKSFTKKSY